MARIDDVARLAGVSTATVSRALRGLPLVSQETRSRVLSAAAELGYVASPSASRLAGGRTGSVGVVVPRVTPWFFATVVEAAEDVLRMSGQDVLLFNLGGREDARRRLLHGSSLHKRVDALLLVNVPFTAEDASAVGRLGLPVVTIGCSWPGLASVCIDDVAAARTATDHLLTLGHTRIAHIAGTSRDEFGSTVRVDRLRGYRESLAAAGLPADPDLVVVGDFSVAGGAEAMSELLRRRCGPSAIFAACDEMAMGAMRVLREAHLPVPERVSVIGIDDHDLSAVLGLTTVAQPAAVQGRLAAMKLLETLGSGTDLEPDPVVVATQLIVRSTTAPPS